MANPWLTHVKKTMKQMKSKGTYEKGKGLSQVIKEAKKTWKKHRGGADEKPADSTTPTSTDGPVETGATMGGRRHRKTARKSRRHSRK